MNDPRDNELSRIYREGAWPEPKRQLDEAILEASRRAARARRSKSFVWRFGPPFALAATVVLTFSLLLRVYEGMPGDKVAPPPVARRAPPVAPRVVRPVEEPKPLAEAAVASKSELAPPPGPVQEQPPAPLASALKKETPAAARADQLQREQIQTQPVRPPTQAYASPPAAAPTAGASAASAGNVSAQLMGTRAPVERAPETWLEDIRKLKVQGKNEDAQRELAEFRKRYPDYRLPDGLR